MVLLLAILVLSNPETLVPYDAVEIEIWHQADLSGRYYVDTDTSLNIPLLGNIAIRGVPIDSLKKALVANLHSYYGDIFLSVNFYYRINVFGEVKSPGSYYVRSGDNLSNLLAQAGGPTGAGSLGRIRILNLKKERVVNFEGILKSGRHAENLNLRPGDVVIVPRRFIPTIQEWSILFTLATFGLQIYNTYHTR